MQWSTSDCSGVKNERRVKKKKQDAKENLMMPDVADCHYALLGICPNGTHDQVLQSCSTLVKAEAYGALGKEQQSEKQKMIRLSDAYRGLGESERRRACDQKCLYSAEQCCPDGWQLFFSNTHGLYYLFPCGEWCLSVE